MDREAVIADLKLWLRGVDYVFPWEVIAMIEELEEIYE